MLNSTYATACTARTSSCSYDYPQAHLIVFTIQILLIELVDHEQYIFAFLKVTLSRLEGV